MADTALTKPAKKNAYFPAIDGLRLLASINIVMLHLGSSNALAYMADYKWLMPIVSAPAFAAGIFYVFAGFLFASKFSDPDRRIPVIPFMFARIAKLYRLHFFMTLLMFVVLVFKFSGYTHLPAFGELGDCASKGLTALILEILSWLAAVLSGVLLFTVYQPTEFARGWQTIWLELGKLQLPPSTPWLVAEAVLVLIAVAATETLKIYLAIALGHLAKKHRALWALLAYVGIGLVLNILFGVGMNSGLLPRILGKSFSWGFHFVEGALTLDSPGVAAGALGSALLFELLLGAAYFFLTRWILKRHLNLE